MPKEIEFTVGEIVSILDSGKKYDAKILKIEKNNCVNHYFIHFQGWAKRWDKWAEPGSVFKKSEEDESSGITKSAENTRKRTSQEVTNSSITTEDDPKPSLAAADSSTKPRPTKATSMTEDEINQIRKRKKQNIAADVVDDSLDANTNQIKLDIPFSLKKHMVDEWEVITQDNGNLVHLPRAESQTVKAVVYDFLELKKKKLEGPKMKDYEDLFEGLLLYFDKALPLVLLYRQEREQENLLSQLHEAHSNKSFPSSEYYGAEHLLRLFVRLPHLFAGSTLSHSERQQVQVKLSELLKFLEKNADSYISMTNYVSAAQEIESLRERVAAECNGSVKL